MLTSSYIISSLIIQCQGYVKEVLKCMSLQWTLKIIHIQVPYMLQEIEQMKFLKIQLKAEGIIFQQDLHQKISTIHPEWTWEVTSIRKWCVSWICRLAFYNHVITNDSIRINLTIFLCYFWFFPCICSYAVYQIRKQRERWSKRLDSVYMHGMTSSYEKGISNEL